MENTKIDAAYEMVKDNQKDALVAVCDAIDALFVKLQAIRATLPEGARMTDAYRAINEVEQMLNYKRTAEMPGIIARLDPPAAPVAYDPNA